MVDQFANFISCMIAVGGMCFSLVVGYAVGYNDAKERK